MNNTQKDRFEKKLIRFIRELDTEWDRYRKQNNIIIYRFLSGFFKEFENRRCFYKKLQCIPSR